MPVSAWGLLATYWPLIFVIGGLDDLYRGKDLPGAVISIGLGALLTAGNLGYLQWDAFQLLLRLWPVFIVAMGLNLLFSGRSWLVGAVGVLLAVALVGGVLWLGMGGMPTRTAEMVPVSQELGTATQGQVTLKVSTGPLHVNAGLEPGRILSGRYIPLVNEQIEKEYTVSGVRGTFRLSTGSTVVIPYPDFSLQPRWDFQVSPQVPMGLDLTLAVGDLKVDLTNTQVERLNLTAAVGVIDLTLAAGQKLDGVISNPVGQTVIHVPEGVSTCLETNFGLAAVDLPAGWTRSEGFVISPGASCSDALVHLQIDLPVGLLTIETIR